MAKWYIYVNDDVKGPYEPEELIQQVTADTQICKAGTENWQKARNVDEFDFGSSDSQGEDSPGSSDIEQSESQTDSPEESQEETTSSKQTSK
ncbi:MAG: DUF4339 domain-containing protein, partial [bacterium]